MATAEQIKSLIRSHLSGDMERFYSIALQVAAHEAQQGHGALALDIRDIVEKDRRERRPTVLKFTQDLHGLVISESPEVPKSALVVPDDLLMRLERIIHEYRQQEKLKGHGLTNRRKIMLIGPPGTGKTMTARILAHELRMTMHIVQVDKMVTKFMGETAAKLRQIFDQMRDVMGAYLFDEFDAIGGERSRENDVGEMRRVLNAFLQFIEQDSSDSLIIATTNSPRLLDKALFRRFDDILYFNLPDAKDRKRLLRNVLGSYLSTRFGWKEVIKISDGLSQAEIDLAARDAIKQSILNDSRAVNHVLIQQMLIERKEARKEIKG